MFCSRTKRKTNIRDQRCKSHQGAVECFSTQKFIFLLTDSFHSNTGPWFDWIDFSQKSSVTLGCRIRPRPSIGDKGPSNCFKSMLKMHPNKPPSMNSHRGYNITGKFARLDPIFTKVTVLFSKSFKAIVLLTYETAIRIKFLNIVKSLTVAV